MDLFSRELEVSRFPSDNNVTFHEHPPVSVPTLHCDMNCLCYLSLIVFFGFMHFSKSYTQWL